MSKDHPSILVVEDETLLLQAITKKLKLSGMDVLSCASGQQAVDYLTNMDELPDAVWLDYYLKDMNGLAFMQALKENPKWEGIPVLVVSNSASPDKVSNMLGLGAKKYILKAEYRLDEIIMMIRDFIADGGTAAPEALIGVPAPGAPVSGASAQADAAAAAPPTVAALASQAAPAVPVAPAAPTVPVPPTSVNASQDPSASVVAAESDKTEEPEKA